MQVTRETLYIRRKPAFKENGISEKSDSWVATPAAAIAMAANNISVLITAYSDAAAACNFRLLKLLHRSATNGVSRDH